MNDEMMTQVEYDWYLTYSGIKCENGNLYFCVRYCDGFHHNICNLKDYYKTSVIFKCDMIYMYISHKMWTDHLRGDRSNFVSF